MIKKMHADVVVVGAGLVGLSAAIALSLQQKNVLLVSDKPTFNDNNLNVDTWDERVYALTPATEIWLKAIGAWEFIDENRVNSIDRMHIWGAESDLLLDATDANVEKLGLIIESQHLMSALWQKIVALGVTVITDARCAKIETTQSETILILENTTQICAKLIVAADGLQSWVRQHANIAVKVKNYHQVAIVANFIAEKPHNNQANQWFNPHDTLALLPLPKSHVSMVWSVSTEEATQLLALSSEQLGEQVQIQSQHLLGELKQIGHTKSAALNQQTALQLIAERIVLIGDAAHQIHPLAGQGVNLGFRDVMKLAELTTKLHSMQDMGEYGFLRQYERARKVDIVRMNSLTSGLDYLFAIEQPMLKKLTHWWLQTIGQQASIKKLLIQQALH